MKQRKLICGKGKDKFQDRNIELAEKRKYFLFIEDVRV